jgi:hypothetical protein
MPLPLENPPAGAETHGARGARGRAGQGELAEGMVLVPDPSKVDARDGEEEVSEKGQGARAA